MRQLRARRLWEFKRNIATNLCCVNLGGPHSSCMVGYPEVTLGRHNPQASVNGDEEEHRQNACSYRRCCNSSVHIHEDFFNSHSSSHQQSQTEIGSDNRGGLKGSMQHWLAV